jgi:hypothetical protein
VHQSQDGRGHGVAVEPDDNPSDHISHLSNLAKAGRVMRDRAEKMRDSLVNNEGMVLVKLLFVHSKRDK